MFRRSNSGAHIIFLAKRNTIKDNAITLWELVEQTQILHKIYMYVYIYGRC